MVLRGFLPDLSKDAEQLEGPFEADVGRLDLAVALELDVIIQSNNGPYVVTDISVDSVGLSDQGTAPQDGAIPDAADAPGDTPAAHDGSGVPDATIDARDGASPGN